MSRIVPTVGVELPHRTSAPLSSSPLLILFDWMTQTWFRFNVLLAWFVMVLVVIAAPAPIGQKLGMLIVSPIAAVIFYFAWYVFLVVVSFLPVVKIPIGFLKLIYFRIFSRLIVQPISVEMPVWL